jgi:hypothetical protein
MTKKIKPPYRIFTIRDIATDINQSVASEVCRAAQGIIKKKRRRRKTT